MADVDALVAALTLDEKAGLLAGDDFFSTKAVDRLGIPKFHLTDGPSGARGPGLPGVAGRPSICIPCGSAVGATWDPDLAGRLGALLGREALARGCRALLAPTVNLHRSPLAGRNFECYSEDPLLSGRLAAGFVRGVQSCGVVATVKHLVGNEAEFERGTISSVIDERSLRELYLLPFELAVRDGGALAIMTSYNRLNGRWLTQQREILLDVLRGEWGFDGFVMTDWNAVADTTSVHAGLDLEMPGPGRAFGAPLADAVREGVVAESDVDRAVAHVLRAFDRAGALDASTAPAPPTPPTDEDLALVRRACIDSIVLLCNDGVLPLRPDAPMRIAVLGPNADRPAIMGGGSAQVTPHAHISPLAALRAALDDVVDVVHERGDEIARSSVLVGAGALASPLGFEAELFEGLEPAGAPTATLHLDDLRLLSLGAPHPDLDAADWSARIRGQVVPAERGTFTLTLSQIGRARVWLDGTLVLDGVADPPPPGGTDFFGMGSADLCADIPFDPAVPVDLVIEYAAVDAPLAGIRVGYRTRDVDALLERAVTAAQAADVAVLVVGTTDEWETETRDRETLALPGRQDELVRRVAAVCPRTVVVVNAAAPVDMPWADDVAAVLQCWFGGQEMGPALAAVLTGEHEPGGRLPVTLPMRLEHNPSHGNFPGENGEVRYGEGLFMGYRGYEHRGIAPRFSFGHGLGYTTWQLGEPEVSASTVPQGSSVTVTVPVTNTGSRAGSTVVQCYLAGCAPRLARPPKELKAFARVRADAGATVLVDLVLDPRSFAYWDPGQPDWHEIEHHVADMFGVHAAPHQERRSAGWQVDPGQYQILIGRSSTDITARRTLELVPSASSDLLRG
jgi:beta-glucosidase